MKQMYTPPFTVSAQAINLITEIAALVERCAVDKEEKENLLLRKVHRIRTIQGSLAIEGNTLSESQVTDIIEGKHVVAPVREIQEVRNAIRVYDRYKEWNPFAKNDLLKAHALMMEALTDDAGKFRRGGVGVFAGSEMIHLAPATDRVPYLINDLFEWLQKSEDHLIIKSCVFHYEFEFIHPFSDGNGRIGRLWQSLLLGRWQPLFEYLPVENMIFSRQQEYYQAIARSSGEADSRAFIDFMLQVIYDSLKERKFADVLKDRDDVGRNDGINVGINERKILMLLRDNERMSMKDLAEALNLSLRQTERLMASLKRKGFIRRIGPNKTGRWEVI